MSTEKEPEDDVIVVERPGPHIVVVRINRPERRNALSLLTRQKMAACFNQLNAEDDVRAVVIAGAPVKGRPYFAAGADIREFVETDSTDLLVQDIPRLLQPIAQSPKPVIAAVAGHALGGGLELAMHADIIIMGKETRVGLPEVGIGLMPGSGGTQRLVRAIGKYRAMLLLLTGLHITAEDAFSMGLASEVVSDEEVEPRAIELAGVIASKAPLAVKQIKDVMTVAASAPLDVALLLERKAAELMFSTDDQKEGARAFLEKRPPEFRRK